MKKLSLRDEIAVIIGKNVFKYAGREGWNVIVADKVFKRLQGAIACAYAKGAADGANHMLDVYKKGGMQ